MIYSNNDVIRNEICKETLEKSVIYFESLSNEMKNIIIDIMLLDYYKLEYLSNKDYPELFEYSKEEIYRMCYYDVNILITLLEATKVFKNISIFNKCVLMDQMNYYNQDNNLMKISNMHILDKISYQFIDDLEVYKEYYVDFKNKDSINLMSTFIQSLSLRLLMLKENDLIKYKKSILEVIKVYYKWKKFIKDHEGEYLLNSEDFNYLNKIENNDIDKLFRELEFDINFLSCVLWEYLHYTTSKLEIKQEIVDEYMNNNCNEQLKKKLKIKDKNKNK